MDWFRHAGLGVFIHSDHASRQGLELSWPLVGRWQWPGYDSPDPASDDVTPAQYYSSAAGFDPVEWDPVGLARRLRVLGAKYVVFTTRHHAGYSMFHTDFSDFGIAHDRLDLTRSLVEAARAEGLRIGLYYSLSDWHHPAYPPPARCRRGRPRASTPFPNGSLGTRKRSSASRRWPWISTARSPAATTRSTCTW
jgi:alpha-L-fucosidase